jgi:lipid-A-disaccharide synthase
MTQPTTFAMVAGEASGDMLAAMLLQGMVQRWPQLFSEGIGGSAMSAYGFKPLWAYEKLAVRGYVEVLKHYWEIIGIRRQLKARWKQKPPSAFIGIDAPDFNLDLAKHLKAQGIPTIHYVCPSIWAWRPERIETIRQSVDHVLCVFPFEAELLERHKIPATYVGHPLAHKIPKVIDRDAARKALNISLDATLVALLPGSRKSEIDYLALRFLKAAKHMAARQPGLQFILPTLPAFLPTIQAMVQQIGGVPGLQICEGQSHAALAACDVTLIASGTATLEAALFKRPMVIAYNMHALSWQIMRRKKLQPWVGLPNILLQDFAVPELLQDAATPEALADETLQWLAHPEVVRTLQARFEALHNSLKMDTTQLATDAIEKIIAH